MYHKNEDSHINTWLKQVREVAFHIEDVIDAYMLHVAWRQDRHGCLRFLKKLKARHQIASEIQNIKKSIGEIKERKERYSFNFSPELVGGDMHNKWRDTRVASLFLDEAELVGLEYLEAELISKLVERTTKIAVISVVGMGGLGKTTLAKKVYDSENITAHFHCKAWIIVSQSYKKEELLRTTIQ